MSTYQPFDRKRLIETLRSTDGYGMTPAQLIAAMDILPGQRRAFRSWIKNLTSQGVVSKGEAQRVRLRRTDSLRGRLKVSPRGFAFIDGSGGKSAFVAPGSFNAFLDGDEVEAELIPGRRGPEGVNLTLIKRHRQRLVGRLIPGYERWILDVEDRRILMPVEVRVGEAKVEPEQVVRVRIADVEGPALPGGTPSLIGILEHVYRGSTALTVEVDRLLAEFGLEPEDGGEPGPVACIDGGAKRIDWTDLPFVTIDPADARDHDDALYARWHERGVELYVAIADVAGFVRPGSALEAMALGRGCSTYLPDRVLPMLPEWLSADAASLRAGVDRPVVGLRMVIDYQGEIVGSDWCIATINSRADLTYDMVQDHLDGEAGALASEHQETVQVLAELARILLARRAKRGQLEISSDELRFEVDEEGEPIAAYCRTGRFAERIVEVCMIAANEEVGRRLLAAETPVPWRVHAPPSEAGLSNFMTVAETVGLKHGRGAVSPHSLNKMMAKLGASPLRQTLGQLLLRAMSKAEYAPEAHGHWGLSSPSYLHFTSPIRRLPDLLVHRAVRYALGDRGAPLIADEDLDQACSAASSAEQRSAGVERAAVRLYACRLLQGREGEEFEGVLDGVAAKGIYVRLLDPPVTVMVAREDIARRGVEFDNAHQRVTWPAGGVLTLGDPLTVKLESVNLAARVANASSERLK